MRNLVLCAGFLLSACATASAPGPVPAGTQLCRNEGLGQFTGQAATQQLGAEMLRVSGVRHLQWVASGMMVTMDFSPERLRVFLTADNRVERASCG